MIPGFWYFFIILVDRYWFFGGKAYEMGPRKNNVSFSNVLQNEGNFSWRIETDSGSAQLAGSVGGHKRMLAPGLWNSLNWSKRPLVPRN
jgi:hypothetical protein